MRTLAGYRNRLVHFYHEVSAEELYEICSTQLGDVEHLALVLRKWFSENSNKVDHTL